MKLPISIFRGAGATGHVFLLRGGKVVDKGLAYSGFVGPMTLVAVVPTTAQILDFAVEARTADNQTVTVVGNVKVTLDPAAARTQLDFTVDARGGYQNPWQDVLRALVIERVMAPLKEAARQLAVAAATAAEPQFEAAIREALKADAALAAKGVRVESCAVAEVTAESDVAEAIGAKELQAMLAEADKAMHDRRADDAKNQRALKTFEVETALKVEAEREKLVEQQGKNEKAKAAADAEATKVRLAPFGDVDPGKALAAALMRIAEGGRVGTINIGPELLAALKGGGAA